MAYIPNTNQQNQQMVGSGFTNLQKYLDVNKTQSEQLGQQVAQQIDLSTDQAQKDITNKGQQFGQQIQSSVQRYDPTTISQSTDQDLNNISQQQYQGPQQAEITSAINPLMQLAQQKAQMADTTGGRTQLIKEIAPDRRQTAGVLGLNQYLLSNTPEARSALNLAVDKAKRELPQMAQSEIAKQQSLISNAQQQVQQQSQYAKSELFNREQQQKAQQQAIEAERLNQIKIAEQQREANSQLQAQKQIDTAEADKQAWLKQQSDMQAQMKAYLEQIGQYSQPQVEAQPIVNQPIAEPTPVTQPQAPIIQPQVVAQPQAPIVEQPVIQPQAVAQPTPVVEPTNQQQLLDLIGAKPNKSGKPDGDVRNPDITTDPKTWDPTYSSYWSDQQKFQYMKATGTQFAMDSKVSNYLAEQANQQLQQNIAQQQALINQNTIEGTQAASQKQAQEVAARVQQQQVQAQIEREAARQIAEQRAALLAQHQAQTQVNQPVQNQVAMTPTTGVQATSATPTASNQQVWELAKQTYGTATPEQILADAAKWDQATSSMNLSYKMTPEQMLQRAAAWTARDQLKKYQAATMARQGTPTVEQLSQIGKNNQPTESGWRDWVSNILGSYNDGMNAVKLGAAVTSIFSDKKLKSNIKPLTVFDVDKILGKYNGNEGNN